MLDAAGVVLGVDYKSMKCDVSFSQVGPSMGAARHGQEGALAPSWSPLLEMRKCQWVFVTVTNCTLEYLNRQ